MAGFDRGVRPIGDWSMSITLSNVLDALDPAVRARPAGAALWSRFFSACRIVVDERRLARAGHAGDGHEAPDRDLDVDVLAGCADARRGRAAPRRRRRRRTGTGIRRRPDRYAPVSDAAARATLAGVPSATTSPPCSPAPGPMSITQSAARIVSSSCSTTITVLPMSRSRVSVSIRRWLSRWCRPIDGSSRMYSTPTRLRADLRGEPDALRLAARQRAGRAVEAQVAEADVDQEPSRSRSSRTMRSAISGLGLGQARGPRSRCARRATDRLVARVDVEARRP